MFQNVVNDCFDILQLCMLNQLHYAINSFDGDSSMWNEYYGEVAISFVQDIHLMAISYSCAVLSSTVNYTS